MRMVNDEGWRRDVCRWAISVRLVVGFGKVLRELVRCVAILPQFFGLADWGGGLWLTVDRLRPTTWNLASVLDFY